MFEKQPESLFSKIEGDIFSGDAREVVCIVPMRDGSIERLRFCLANGLGQFWLS